MESRSRRAALGCFGALGLAMTQRAALPHLLILGVSGRALAQAARRAGFAPLVADFFCDRDTRQAAVECVKIEGDIADGLHPYAVRDALSQLTSEAASPPVGLVYGSGFEAQQRLINAISAFAPVLGNKRVATLKFPRWFFRTLDMLGIAHPETRFEGAIAEPGWLLKRIGASGGSHIRRLTASVEISDVDYAQHPVEGRSVSALTLSDETGTRVLGFSEQWRAPAPDKPFRYGGAVQPAGIAHREAARMAEIASAIGNVFGLRGLGSIDFMLGYDGPLVLEVNPRPGATLDIFDSDAHPLLAMHIAACESRDRSDCDRPALWNEAFVRLRAAGDGKGRASPAGTIIIETHGPNARATQTVFARRQLTVPENINWPDWTADRPHSGETIAAHRPVCTVLAAAETPAAARSLAAQRESAILESLEAHEQARVEGG